jgi:hypothetical protein
MKTGPDALSTAKIIPDAQNVKTEPDVLGTTENEIELTKYENET